MARKNFNVLEIDTSSNVAYTDDGDMLEIDSYTDKYDEMCDYVDAVYAYVRTGAYSMRRVRMHEELDEE
jgi:hypothetical protein